MPALRDLRDRIARALPEWSPSTPGYGLVLGMYAFGLEEAGDYARAEERGRQAIDAEPLDCWAHHAVAHVMEMQGRAQDGIGWMISREPYWAADDNFFKIHNWWHRALCHLDLGQSDEGLRLYDGPIRGGRSMVALDLVDASALLWRLHLTGHDVGDRWAELAQAWDQHADGRLYPFNDWHAVMAYLGSGREAEVARVVGAMERSALEDTDVARWARAVALPLIHGSMRGKPARGALHRESVRRQPRPARRDRLDADRGRRARRPDGPRRGARPRASGRQATQSGQPGPPDAGTPRGSLTTRSGSAAGHHWEATA